MKRKPGLLKQFSTVWAIEDPVDELHHFIDEVDSYKLRFKHIISLGLFLSLSFFIYVIISLLLKIFAIGNVFLFSQSLGAYYLIESSIELSIPLLTLPFITIVILFLVQSWKFYEVLLNRLDTTKKLWDEQSNKLAQNNENALNPMELSMMLLGEMEQQIFQVKKQILITIFSFLFIISIVSFFLSLIFIIQDISFSIQSIGMNIIIPIFLILLTLFFIPLLVELRRFLSWQYQKFLIIKAIYSKEPPVPSSESHDSIARLQSYLEKDLFLNKKKSLSFVSSETIRHIHFDLYGTNTKNYVFVRKTKTLIPSKGEIDQFRNDICKVLDYKQIYPKYLRAILLCDWREEEEDIPESIEQKIYHSPIKLGRSSGGGKGLTYIQIIIDYGKMYSMFPLVPEKNLDE